jgi:hypothetical protein
MKINRLVFLIVFLSFLFPALACSLGSAVTASKTPAPTAIPPAQVNTQAPTTAPGVPSAFPTAIPSAVGTAVIPTTLGTSQGAIKPPSEAPTAVPAATSRPAGTPLPAVLQITSLTSFKDSSSNFHVVGEVFNGEDKPLTSIELTISILNASGKTLLKDSSGKSVDTLTFSPMLSTLLPGRSSPFEYFLTSDAGVPDKFDVKITGQNTGDIQTASLMIQNAQMKVGANDTVYLTGDIVNKGDKPVQIYNMAGALLDKDKKVIAAAATSTYSAYLQPAGDSADEDRTPFAISIDNPGSPVDSYATYLEADQVDPLPDNSLKVDITNNYFDDTKQFHVVGTLTNNSSQALHTFLVGGLYAKDGTALDADYTVTPIDIQVGQSLPYDISAFGNVNNNADEAALVDHFTVQVDRATTFHSSFVAVSLNTSKDVVDKSANTTWQFTGQIANTSGKALTDETVIVAVYDAKSALVASNWTLVSPKGDSIAPGETSPYELSVYLDPSADLSSLTYKTFVAGEVK